MRRSFYLFCFLTFAMLGYSSTPVKKTTIQNPCKLDLTKVRGFNYTPAFIENKQKEDCWVKYNKSVIEHDLDLAKSLNLNQVRVFVRYNAYQLVKDSLAGRLQHFIRESHKRGMGVMLVLDKRSPWDNDTTLRPLARQFAQFLIKAVSGQPGLIMWDVMNEPDYPTKPKELTVKNSNNCKFMAKLFHELDKKTPITIGMAYLDGMEELADYVDVLQYHDYEYTRERIRKNIDRAKKFAAKVGKPLINGEIGCICRANPYDVALEEFSKGGVGWYIWELMIVRNGWGVVHGVFYEDGTVRDPSIAAAILGFYRKRDANILPAVPDYEGWVTKSVDKGNQWLLDPNATWSEGLDIAETCANLMESAELVPMRTPPTRDVRMLREGNTDMAALKVMMKKYIEILEPYKLKKKS